MVDIGQNGDSVVDIIGQSASTSRRVWLYGLLGQLLSMPIILGNSAICGRLFVLLRQLPSTSICTTPPAVVEWREVIISHFYW